METQFDFSPGDIIEQAGECFQVLENRGTGGVVRNFPADDDNGFEFQWESDDGPSRRIGQAPLPAPSPCSTGGSCPTYEIKPKTKTKTKTDKNIIASQG